LDFLTVKGPMTQGDFLDCMNQISRDPEGPYGQVLRRCPVSAKPEHPEAGYDAPHDEPDRNDENQIGGLEEEDDLISLLRRIIDPAAAREYEKILEGLETLEEPLKAEETAMLVIDPQRSFTKGAWMRSIGPDAESEVAPIRWAFRNCARVIRGIKGRIETLFSRCPFPPDSYDWDEPLVEVIDPDQHYFVKPGNNILWPRTNGFREWVIDLLARGKTTLVLGGCTLNSCVRVSAVEVQRCFADHGLQVVVDLSLCGGRRGNYVESSEFSGRSSVAAAIQEMISAGVRVCTETEENFSPSN
jgi:nicotinamidase-related amidase